MDITGCTNTTRLTFLRQLYFDQESCHHLAMSIPDVIASMYSGSASLLRVVNITGVLRGSASEHY